MTKRVQLIGGDAASQDVFVGDEREITIDESNFEIRVHDGVTPGGHRIPNRDSSDQRYQQQNAELSAFAGFDATKRGLLVRLGPTTYRFRSIVVNAANLTIANADGYLGNPALSIAATITSSHVWQGDNTFTESINAAGGLIGETSGLHTGAVTGDVTGSLTGNVTGNVTGDLVGGIDTRGAVTQFDDASIPFSAMRDVPAGVAPVPAGAIMGWSGDSTDVPSGWFLCDGANGTPDLRGMFIIGAGTNDGDAPPHQTGGTATHTHVITIDADGTHDHTITVADHQLTIAEMPAHLHGSGVCDTVSGNAFNHGTIAAAPAAHDNIQSDSGTTGGFEAKTTSVGGDGNHSHGGSSDDSGNHTHSASAADGSNVPPFYSLCMIMKGPG